MNTIHKLDIRMHGDKVGALALLPDQRVAFEYDAQWLLDGFAISPLSLPLEKKVFVGKPQLFEGLFGVFSDSLPDGWGRLLLDRMLRRERKDPYQISVLQRLAIVGDTGMGALTYHPSVSVGGKQKEDNLDRLARECEKILADQDSEDLDTLFALGGSSGGARPKIYTTYQDEEWLVKFPSSQDRKSIGSEEYRYALCAKACGIDVEKVRLLPSKNCDGYFGTRRFDRHIKEQRENVHMVTVSGLLETSHRIPNLDYHTLMKLTWILTKDAAQIEQMYRRMCFNVYAHNRDDHSKNFAFLYDREDSRWYLSPAYDMTYSYSIGGEHATCVNGNGRDPGRADLLEVGLQSGLSENKAIAIADEIKEIVREELREIIDSYEK